MKLLVDHTKYELYFAYGEIFKRVILLDWGIVWLVLQCVFFMRLKITTCLNANRITTAFFYRYRYQGNLSSVYFSQLNRRTDSKYYCIFWASWANLLVMNMAVSTNLSTQLFKQVWFLPLRDDPTESMHTSQQFSFNLWI